ncbi:methyl-accepting chemotaxis protein [Vibrio sp. JC009]|uniref:methyl-accepting chemotaxis protein n=1 Tax=Vibrio sp. JC009 TaxID=2912314 RepID=UPI0023AF60FE|nr:methyl-accepting chemotaxis protein [Vibrio sp. JC009]WED22857.1 methyl-accepting chemotaxis protein [Vibrio sp. JC009]
MKIRLKISLWMVIVATIPLLFSITLISISASDNATEALENSYSKKLLSIRNARKTQIEDYFAFIRSQILTLSSDSMTAEAMSSFSRAFDEAATPDTKTTDSLHKYYRDQFGQEFSKQNNSQSISTESLLEQLTPKEAYWQTQYISQNPHPLGSKHKLSRAAEENNYNQLHQHYHPQFSRYLQEFGYYDIFLVDAQSGHIVYSVFKELDFATSLKTGPYADSGIGRAYQQALSAGNQDSVVLIDFEPYVPSYNAQASFIASPVTDENNVVLGVLIFQMPIERINHIMTSGGEWQKNGLGLSGETYLLGQDYKARSVSRFLLEDPEHYQESLIDNGISEHLVRQIIAKGSNIGLQEIRTQASEHAVNGQTGFDISPDYRGISVLSAYAPLDIPGLNWVILSEIGKDEAFAGARKLQDNIFYMAVITLLGVSILAIATGILISRSMTRPIIEFSGLLRKIEQENNLQYRSDISSKDELGDMATALNIMLEKFSTLLQEANDSAQLVARTSEELNLTSKQNVQGIEAQKEQTQQIAAAMDQMVVAIREVATHTTEAADVAHYSAEQAETGKEIVLKSSSSINELSARLTKCSDSVKELSDKSQNIGNITEVIKEVAEQTNLLALNAAIEAARAGESGRGFAVVADEVRSLALRTQSSIQKIDNTVEQLQAGTIEVVDAIEQSQNDASASVEYALQVNSALEDISASIEQIRTYNVQNSDSMQEQSVATEQMNINIRSINDIALQTAAGSEQSATSARELADSASRLQGSIDKFNV